MTTDGVYVLLDRILRGALGALLLIGSVSCTEELTGSLGCPELCTDESATLRDTTLVGVVLIDSTLTGYPKFGTHARLHDARAGRHGRRAARDPLRYAAEHLPPPERRRGQRDHAGRQRTDLRGHRHDDRAPHGPGDGRHVRRRHDRGRLAHDGARPPLPPRPPHRHPDVHGRRASATRCRCRSATPSCWRRRRPERDCVSASASARRSRRRSFASPVRVRAAG